MGNQTGRGKPASTAGHAEAPAASVVAVVSPDPGLCSERARRCLLDRVIQYRRRVAQALYGQEAVRQEAQRCMMVEALPGATLEVVQAQLLFELLIALLHVPACLPHANSLRQGRRGWQVGQGVA